MRCNNCGKVVPNTTINCPYCAKTIDPNAVYVDQTVYEEVVPQPTNTKEKIQEFTKNTDKKKLTMIGGAFVAVIVLIIGIAVAVKTVSGPSSVEGVFTKYLAEKYEEYTELLLANNGNSGKYTLTLDINGDDHHYEGNYDLKLIDRYFYLDGEKNSNSNTSGIVISDDENFSFSTFLLKNILYIDSPDFYDEQLYFELPDEDGLLKTNKLNVKSLTNGVAEALIATLDELPTTEGKETMYYFDEEVKANCLTWRFNNKNKKMFIQSFFEILKEDSSFVNEYAKMTGKKKEEVVKILDSYKTTLIYRVKNSKDMDTYFNVYYGTNKIYKIELDYNTEELDFDFTLIIGNNTDVITVGKDDEKLFELSVTKSEKELSNGIHKSFKIKYTDSSKNTVKGDLVLDTVNKPNIRKKKESATAVNGYNLNAEQHQEVKENISSLTGFDWFDQLTDYVRPICTKKLNCTCQEEADTCNCQSGTTFVTCTKDELANSEEE